MRFFLIDRIVRWEVPPAAAAAGDGSTPCLAAAEAIKNVALSEDFFDDHFPRHPVLPGVLIIEGMAQLAGLLVEACQEARTGRRAKAVLTILERTKFRHMVRPGDSLRYQAEVASLQDAGGKARVRALRDGRLVASTEMVFALQEVQDPALDARRRELLEIWRRPGEEAPAAALGSED